MISLKGGWVRMKLLSLIERIVMSEGLLNTLCVG